jgi:hypothetical protein
MEKDAEVPSEIRGVKRAACFALFSGAAFATCANKCREAQAKFEHATEVIGRSSSLLYSIALCNYKQNKPGEALKYLAQVIEKVCLATSSNTYMCKSSY